MPLYYDKGPSNLTLPLRFRTPQIRGDAVQESLDRYPETSAYMLRRDADRLRREAAAATDATTAAALTAEASRAVARADLYDAVAEERRRTSPDVARAAEQQSLRDTERAYANDAAFGKATRDVLLQQAEALLAVGNYCDSLALRKADATQGLWLRPVPERR